MGLEAQRKSGEDLALVDEPTDRESGRGAALQTQNQRRLTWRLLSYWEQVRGDRDFPTLDDIKPAEIEQIWPYCFILDVKDFCEFPYFRYLGRSFARYSGIFLCGQHELSHTLLNKAVCHYREAISRGAPVLVEEELTQFDNKKLLFRSVLLPLSEDQENVTYLLGAANGSWSRD